jgi:PKD repeat protein
VTYSAAGSYTVTLIAANVSGASAPVTRVITVTASASAPTASFTTSTVSGISPLLVNLTDTERHPHYQKSLIKSNLQY